jgi:GNAT superfamily N-acetyltransferase
MPRGQSQPSGSSGQPVRQSTAATARGRKATATRKTAGKSATRATASARKSAAAKTGSTTISRKKTASTKQVEEVEVRPSGTVYRRRSLAPRPAVWHKPHVQAGPSRPPEWMLAEPEISPARAGEQAEILQLLSGLSCPPTRGEFQAAVDHPDHDSANRLVARLGGRIVGHAEVVPRHVFIAGVPVPSAAIDRLAILPECRGAGHGQRLVRETEARMRSTGCMLGLSRTRIAPSFHQLGWSVLGRDGVTPGRPTDILSRLLERQAVAEAPHGSPVTMRQWRHVELPAVLRVYNQNAARFTGPCDRGEAYSRWLVSRGAFDSLLVALVGNDRYDLHETNARIVGYCIQQGNRVLELLADPEFPGLDQQILARVCSEAIENDRQEIVYESAVGDPLHRFVAGPDSTADVSSDRMIVARVFDPAGVLELIAPAIAARLAAEGVGETIELGLDTPSFRGSLLLGKGKAKVQTGRVGRSYLRLSDDEFTRLVLGQCDPAEAAAAGRLAASTQVAQKFAMQVFPRTPLWCPMWDDLPA